MCDWIRKLLNNEAYSKCVCTFKREINLFNVFEYYFVCVELNYDSRQVLEFFLLVNIYVFSVAGWRSLSKYILNYSKHNWFSSMVNFFRFIIVQCTVLNCNRL